MRPSDLSSKFWPMVTTFPLTEKCWYRILLFRSFRLNTGLFPSSLFFTRKNELRNWSYLGSKTTMAPSLNMSWTSWSTKSNVNVPKRDNLGSLLGKGKGISKPRTTSRIIGSLVSLCQFFTKKFTLPALGSWLIFTGSKFTTGGFILQNSDEDRRSVELIKRAINISKFIFTLCLFSWSVLILQGLMSSCEHFSPLISFGSKLGAVSKELRAILLLGWSVIPYRNK